MFRDLIYDTMFQNLLTSIKLSISLGFISFLSPIPSNWMIENVDYIFIALSSIAIDHALGSYTHQFIKEDWNWRRNIGGFFTKLSMVVAVGFLMEGLAHITIKEDLIYVYIKMVGRLIVVIYPIRSALLNVKIITKGAFPPDALVGKMDKFNKDLDLKNFKNKDNETN